MAGAPRTTGWPSGSIPGTGSRLNARDAELPLDAGSSALADACIAQKWACTRLGHFNETSHPPLAAVNDPFPRSRSTGALARGRCSRTRCPLARRKTARTWGYVGFHPFSDALRRQARHKRNGDSYVIASLFRQRDYRRAGTAQPTAATAASAIDATLPAQRVALARCGSVRLRV